MKAKRESIFVLSIDSKIIAASTAIPPLSDEIGISSQAVHLQVKQRGIYKAGGTIIERVLWLESGKATVKRGKTRVVGAKLVTDAYKTNKTSDKKQNLHYIPDEHEQQ